MCVQTQPASVQLIHGVQLNWNGEQQHKSHEFIQIELNQPVPNQIDCCYFHNPVLMRFMLLILLDVKLQNVENQAKS